MAILATTTLLFGSLVVTGISVVIFIAVTGAAWFVIGRASEEDAAVTEARLDRLRRDPRKGGHDESAGNSRQAKRDALASQLEKVTQPLEKTVTGSEQEMSKLREKLLTAGFRRERSPIVFRGLQLIIAGVFLAIGGVFGLMMDGFSQGLIMKAAMGLALGYFGPTMVLGMMAKKRMEKVFLGLPDALDLMVVCVEAGLGIDQALRKVADEMSKSHKEIGEEFAIANQQLQFGRTRAEVLQALGFRSGVDDLKQLASILIQADKFGSSVAQALRVQSDSMRTRRRQIAEEKAAKTAVKMIFPLVVFIFPGIFVVLVGPAAISMYRKMLSVPTN